MTDTKACPYCAETIRAEARRCRYCRSRIVSLDPGLWHRDHPEARLAGVSVAVARATGLPLTGVRAGFAVACLFHLLGLFAYGLLWMAIPPKAGADSWLERVLRRSLQWASCAGGKHGTPQGPGGDAGALTTTLND